ncbi:MAG: hypothetical protein E7557_01155 [Ruminococcaceae bacterium]|nr:hypothetical protein [Oscillospiraceae bacterium]
MIIVVCIDDNDGMLFNNRRQSRDKAVIYDLIKYSNGSKILINEFSKTIFSDYENNIIISDSFLNNAKENDLCFVENVDLSEFKDKINKFIIYHWNRAYPADFYFNSDLSNFKLTEAKEFTGNSHDKITREIYSL